MPFTTYKSNMSRPEACSGDRLDFLPLKSLAKCSRNRILGRKRRDTTLPFGLFLYADFLIVGNEEWQADP